MKKFVPPSHDLRNPLDHLDLARGDANVFSRLFSELPAAEDDPPEDDGPHEPFCPCWRCDTSQVYSEPDEDETFDMARDLADDRRFS